MPGARCFSAISTLLLVVVLGHGRIALGQSLTVGSDTAIPMSVVGDLLAMIAKQGR